MLGSVLGAAFMTFVPEILRLVGAGELARASRMSPACSCRCSSSSSALLIIGFLIFEPHGLAAIWARIRRTFHLWPFRT